jgi:hypothetical protein
MNIPDHISESFNSLMRIWDPEFFDPGSGIRDGKIWIRDLDKHPGSATPLKSGGSTFSKVRKIRSRLQAN